MPPAFTDMLNRAASLDERRRGMWTPAHAGLDVNIDPQVRSWRATVAEANEAYFAKRLQWDHLDAAEVQQVLSGAQPPCEVPGWATLFRAAYGEGPAAMVASFEESGTADRSIDPKTPLPFDELFVPFIRVARERLQQRAGEAYDLLTSEAHIGLERNLLAKLSGLCAQPLYAQFSTLRVSQRHLSLSAALMGMKGGRLIYQAFVGKMKAGGLFSFFHTYSVAARLCATVVQLWIEAKAEFLLRLQADWDALHEVFGAGTALGMVEQVQMGAGDAHNGGRGVGIFRCQSGVRIVYKPRAIGLELVYTDLLAWINESEDTLDLRMLRYIDRTTYGWIEFVAHDPCTTQEEVRRFYTRVGMLMALIYTLNGNDFHYENLIACGEHPVLIDMEGMITPHVEIDPEAKHAQQAEDVAEQRFKASIARSGMLPTPKHLGDGCVVDTGGLGREHEEQAGVLTPCWVHVNTDQMKMDRLMAQPMAPNNLPVMDGKKQHGGYYIEEIVKGFETVYRLVMAQRGTPHEQAWLASLKQQPVRFIFRPTKLYVDLIRRAMHPKYLRDGMDRSIALDILARPLLQYEERPLAWDILQAERHSLEQMDVPLFWTWADSTTLHLPNGGEIAGFLDSSALEEVLHRFASLSEADLAFQTSLIRMALGGQMAITLAPPLPGRPTRPVEEEVTPAAFQALARAEATRMAGILEQEAVASKHGKTWFGLHYDPAMQRYLPGPLPPTLFSGSAGTALCLAALEHITQTGQFRQLALDAIGPIRQRAQSGINATGLDRSYLTRWEGRLGLGEGLASGIYVLATLATLLDEPVLLDEAQRLAASIPGTQIEADTAFDVFNGTAGLLLALLAFHQKDPQAARLEQALWCGEHLLEAFGSVPAESEAADPLNGRTGLAMGPAGIALALLWLGLATSDHRFEALAQQLIAAGAQHNTEPLSTLLDPHAFSWSYGTTGWGLLQVAAVKKTGQGPTLHPYLDSAQQHLWAVGDNLCSGAMGRIELMLSAALALDDPSLLQTTRNAAAAVVTRAQEQGRYELGWGAGFFHAGFFQGVPGIAYQLLRVAYPQRLPSVLAWC